MKMFQRPGKAGFTRITDSTSYLPEIDGLRFLAIFMVVVLLHITHYIDLTFYKGDWIKSGFWKNFIFENGFGMSLFFAISGFILALPFAKWRLKNGKPVDLKHYFLRRLTRLEPPYIIVLLVLFCAQVWILKQYSFTELLPHLGASIIYIHNLFYQSFSLILPASWSLEVEVQFYLIAPLLFMIYRVKSALLRRTIMLAVIVLFTFLFYDYWSTPMLPAYFQVFVTGMLLCDLYTTGWKPRIPGSLLTLTGLLALCGFLFIPTIHDLPGYSLRLFCMFWLMYAVLNSALLRGVFSLKPFIRVGIMGYSIYLLHFAIISLTGELLKKSSLPVDRAEYFLPTLLLFLILILSLSALFFLLIEKPFMSIRFNRTTQKSRS